MLLRCRAALTLPRSHAKQKVHWAVLPGAARSWGRQGLCPRAPSRAAGLRSHLRHGRGVRSQTGFQRDLGWVNKGLYDTGCLQKRLGTAWPFLSRIPVVYVTRGGGGSRCRGFSRRPSPFPRSLSQMLQGRGRIPTNFRSRLSQAAGS